MQATIDNSCIISDISVMTEISDTTLSTTVESFVLQWGDMGSFWGVNRSIAQIHALLYLSDVPLTAEDIAVALAIARSNVSNSLKELLGWKLIIRKPVRGDRRDHYVAETDLWLVSQRIAQGRKAREIDPTLETLKACVAAAQADDEISATATKRLRDMLEFVRDIDSWYTEILTLPHSTLRSLMKLGSRVTRVLRVRAS